MILNKTNIKRLVIYFFYDENGVVDRYVPYMLDDVKRNCSEIFVVVNGKLNVDGRRIFNDLGVQLMVRENVGFDVWAYKEALEHYGWSTLAEYDEVIMMNHTIMGPLYPFSEMFEEMDKRDVDFWGLTVFHKYKANPYNISYGYIPKHLQSHFIAVRSNMISSIEFQKYWAKRPMIKSYTDAVGQHEAIFTKYFADKGFTWDVYINTEDLEDYTEYPLMMCPERLIVEKRCPIFKRRTFFHNYESYIEESNGSQARKLLALLKKQFNYDIGMIWENIIRTSHMRDIRNCLNLSWSLPKDYIINKTEKNRKVALVMHLYYEDLISYCYEYALSMPEYSDIIITTDSKSKIEAITEQFSKGNWNSIKVVAIGNRGRDVSSLLVEAAKYINNYDYVCFAHDKKVKQLDAEIKGYYFSERCFENILGSREYVLNILNRFDEETYLGMICPPPPNHSDYFITLGCEWGPNYNITEKLYNELELTVPISIHKEPVAPLGTMFWFRPNALRLLTDRGWEYKDFPKEPIAIDGTLLHAIERIYPYAVQQSGYYVAWCFTNEYAANELTNLQFMLRTQNTFLFAIYGINKFNGLTGQLSQYASPITPKRKKIKNALKKITPKPIWILMKKIYHSFGGKKWVG